MSAPLPKPAPLPIRRKRLGHSGHSGGAWKVAYADFVTAMMALFIVLWIMNSSSKVKQSVQGYFRDPQGYESRTGTGVGAVGESLVVDQRKIQDVRKLIEAALRQMPEFPQIENNVVFTVTAEGLRIDLIETSNEGMFFRSGSLKPTDAGEHLLKVLADQLARVPNEIVIEGHTDAQPFRAATLTSGYSNWELAVDRANTTRRLLYAAGLHLGQIAEVRGFADRMTLPGATPEDPRNRRVSVVVKSREGSSDKP